MKLAKYVVFFSLVLASVFLTTYIVFSFKAEYDEHFLQTFGSVFLLVLKDRQVHNLLLASALVSITSLLASGAVGYYAARFSNLEKLMSFLPFWKLPIPEIFAIVLLDLIFSGFGFRIRGLSDSWKFLIIFSVVVMRRWVVFYDYFKSALENYQDSIAYKLVTSRGIRGLKREKYLLKNTLMDSLSSLSFEIPLILSYISIMERVVVYNGISHNFFRALRESMVSGELLKYAIPIVIFFLIVQFLLKSVELFVWKGRRDIL